MRELAGIKPAYKIDHSNSSQGSHTASHHAGSSDIQRLEKLSRHVMLMI